MLGLAAQHGKLPVGSDPIEEAIRLNDVAVEKNLLAFSLGRLAMCDPERFSALAPTEQQPPVSVATTLDGLIAERMAHLRAYQDARLAARFEHLVHQIQAAEERVAPRSEAHPSELPSLMPISYAVFC